MPQGGPLRESEEIQAIRKKAKAIDSHCSCGPLRWRKKPQPPSDSEMQALQSFDKEAGTYMDAQQAVQVFGFRKRQHAQVLQRVQEWVLWKLNGGKVPVAGYSLLAAMSSLAPAVPGLVANIIGGRKPKETCHFMRLAMITGTQRGQLTPQEQWLGMLEGWIVEYSPPNTSGHHGAGG